VIVADVTVEGSETGGVGGDLADCEEGGQSDGDELHFLEILKNLIL